MTYVPCEGQALEVQQREEDGEEFPGVRGEVAAEKGEGEWGHGGDGETEVGPGFHLSPGEVEVSLS